MEPQLELPYPGLPHESVGVTVSQFLHDPLNRGPHLLGVGVTAVHHLQDGRRDKLLLATSVLASPAADGTTWFGLFHWPENCEKKLVDGISSQKQSLGLIG